MATDVPPSTLAQALRRYESAATEVNQREMTRFVDEIRSKFVPIPEIPDGDPLVGCVGMSIEPPRGEGYTIEGAICRQAYHLAFDGSHWDDDFKPRSEAEEWDQVYDRNASTFVEDINPPLPASRPPHELQQILESLQQSLRDQAGRTDLHLPPDFKELMSLTNGVSGAGVPSENCHLELIHGIERQGNCADLRRARRHLCFMDVVAGWEIGGSNWDQRCRQIFYVLCRSHDGTDQSLQWTVVDCQDFEEEIHTGLEQFIDAETERIVRGDMTPRSVVLIYDEYPIF